MWSALGQDRKYNVFITLIDDHSPKSTFHRLAGPAWIPARSENVGWPNEAVLWGIASLLWKSYRALIYIEIGI